LFQRSNENSIQWINGINIGMTLLSNRLSRHPLAHVYDSIQHQHGLHLGRLLGHLDETSIGESRFV